MDTLVGLQLVVGLRRDANLEREGLAAFERTGGLRKSWERRRDVALVDGERHEVLHGLLLHDASRSLMPSCFSTACSTDMPGVGCTPICWANLY